MLQELNCLEKTLCKILINSTIPNHIAFIMDGNRRYATNLGKKGLKGH